MPATATRIRIAQSLRCTLPIDIGAISDDNNGVVSHQVAAGAVPAHDATCKKPGPGTKLSVKICVVRVCARAYMCLTDRHLRCESGDTELQMEITISGLGHHQR